MIAKNPFTPKAAVQCDSKTDKSLKSTTKPPQEDVNGAENVSIIPDWNNSIIGVLRVNQYVQNRAQRICQKVKLWGPVDWKVLRS